MSILNKRKGSKDIIFGNESLQKKCMAIDVSKKLKAEMEKAGITQSELARRMGITPQNLYNTLMRNNFTTKNLSLAAEALGCDVDLVFKPKKNKVGAPKETFSGVNKKHK